MTGTQPEVTTSSKEEWKKYKVTIEPVLMLTFYLFSVSGSPLTDLVIRQSCRQLNLDPYNCTNDESTDEEVHRTSSSFSMWHVIIGTLPGCIMSLFTSPWSDTNGRKPVIIIALIGTALTNAWLSYMSTIPDLHPYTLLTSSIPSVFTGGSMLLILNSFCYIIDVTNNDNRAIRIAIMMNGSAIGSLIAQFAAPYLEKLGYDWLFASNAVLVVTAIIYVVVLLPESVNVVEEKRKKLLTTEHLVDSIRTFFKKRPNNARGILFCLLIASCSILLLGSGELDVKYLSTIKKFDWTIQDYSTYTAVSTVLMDFYQIQIDITLLFHLFTLTSIVIMITWGRGPILTLGTLSGVYFGLKVLKLSEQMFCLVLMSMVTVSSFLTTCSRSPEEFYIFSQMKVFSACLGPAVKSSMSRVVLPEEVSKVIAFQSSAEAFMPQIGAILYSKWYNLVVGFDAFAIYYLSALLGLVGSLSFLINMVLYRMGKWDCNGTSQEMEKDTQNNDTTDKDLEANSSL